ncbi:MAG TPA: tyrosine-type recombinase/integrase [Nitrospira sp.]|nr:tyrosine-type recombinase/integrase [Nitrospira sp.]
MAKKKQPLTGEKLTAAIKALAPGKELWVEPGIFVRRNKNDSLSYFVRIHYKGEKYEFWDDMKDHLTAKARHINLKLEIAECSNRNENWIPPSKNTIESSSNHPAGMTLKQWAEVWYQEVVCQKNARGTRRKYREYLNNHVYPVLGPLPLTKITTVELQNLVHAIRAKRAPRRTGNLSQGTAKTILRMLYGCFCGAFERKLIEALPFPIKRTNLLGAHETTFIRKTWTTGQVQDFLAGVLRCDPEWHPIFMTFFRSACRLGEVLALTPESLDFLKGEITISQAYSEGVVGPTKTKRVNTIHMSQELSLVLQAYLKQREREEEIRGLKFTYLFGWQRDTPIAPNTLRDRFKKLTNFLGLPPIRVHDTRHTAAEIMLEGGAPTVYVRDQLRHSSESTTADVYGATLRRLKRHVNLLDKEHTVRRTDTHHPSHNTPANGIDHPGQDWPIGPLLPSRDGVDFRQAIHLYEQQLIGTALKLAKGSRTTAAALLRLPRATFLTKLSHLGRSTNSGDHKARLEDGQDLFNPVHPSHGTAA